jgi:hypothetical protein
VQRKRKLRTWHFFGLNTPDAVFVAPRRLNLFVAAVTAATSMQTEFRGGKGILGIFAD